MANDPVFRVDAAAVVSDIIAGEAVMLHRVSGDYFSTDGVGCLIWEWIGGGQSRGSILNGLNQRFATDPAKIETAVERNGASQKRRVARQPVCDGPTFGSYPSRAA
jgi:hypothetical protein